MTRDTIFVEDGFYLCVEIYFLVRCGKSECSYGKQHNDRNNKDFSISSQAHQKSLRGLKVARNRKIRFECEDKCPSDEILWKLHDKLCGFRKLNHGGNGVDCTAGAEASRSYVDTKGTKKHEGHNGGIKIVDRTRMTRPSGTGCFDLFFPSILNYVGIADLAF